MKPSGMTINSSTGMINWTPTAKGSFGANVKVEDDGYPVLSDNQSFIITVSDTTIRIISLSGDLDFGTVQVGSTSTKTLRINNTGNSTLQVYGITYPTGFSGNWTGDISAEGYHDVTITFAPTEVISYGGYLTVDSNKTDGINTKAIFGTGDMRFPAPIATDGTYTDKVKITWDSVTGATHYQVYRATSATGTKTAITSWQTSTTYYDYSVTPGTIYYYFFKAATDSNGSNASDYSDYDDGFCTTIYALRDIGPAGGYIFYDKGSYSNGWRYLEAASVSTQYFDEKWGSLGTLIGGTEMGIGTGQSNTTTIVTWLNSHSETGKAAQLCNDLTEGGYSDWFLPSLNELKLMYTNLKLFGVGDFSSNELYWSSTENTSNTAWSWFFFNGTQFDTTKDGSFKRARAARAF